MHRTSREINNDKLEYKVIYSNAIFSYLDVLDIKAIVCDSSPQMDVQRCWQYMIDNDIVMYETFIVVSMQGYETYDILQNNYP